LPVLGHNVRELAEDVAHLDLGDQAEGIQDEMYRRALLPNGIADICCMLV